jgi:hypothetical protein
MGENLRMVGGILKKGWCVRPGGGGRAEGREAKRERKEQAKRCAASTVAGGAL